MTDLVDEWALNDFGDMLFQSVVKGVVNLGKLQDELEKKAAETFKPLLAEGGLSADSATHMKRGNALLA